MEWHRHRIHPLLWEAQAEDPGGTANDAVRKELQAWQRAGVNVWRGGRSSRKPV
jgi:hypothetical protein